MNNKLIVLLTGIILFNSEKSLSQGCSDAGICTVGNSTQHRSDELKGKKHKISLLLNNGIGDENVYVFTPAVQYDFKVNNSLDLQAKLTGNYASGHLANATGLGDLFISGTYSIARHKNWALGILLGTKIPLNTGDIRSQNKPLPMQYQSSLGTIDALLGLSFNAKTFTIATAVQQPLSGRNRNTFLPVYWNTNEANKYPPSNDFNRKGDLILKTAYHVIRKNNLKLSIGLLGIYHLGSDTYIDGNLSVTPIKINGSEGITLNGTAALKYMLNSRFSIGIAGGFPFAVRDKRPDGLTRKFVLTPEISFTL